MIKSSTFFYFIDDFIPSGMRTNDLQDPDEYLMDEITGCLLDDLGIEPPETLIQETLKKVIA